VVQRLSEIRQQWWDEWRTDRPYLRLIQGANGWEVRESRAGETRVTPVDEAVAELLRCADDRIPVESLSGATPEGIERVALCEKHGWLLIDENDATGLVEIDGSEHFDNTR
jgi:hypothetical protein